MISPKELKLMIQLNNRINEAYNAKGSDFEIDDDFLYRMSKMYGVNEAEVIDALIKLIVSVVAFTGLSVDVVKDPSKFDPKKASSITTFSSFNNEYFLKNYDPSIYDGVDKLERSYRTRNIRKDDYALAHVILGTLSKIKTTEDSIADMSILYRGVFGMSFNSLNAWARPGSVFDLGDIASTSLDQYFAEEWANKAPINILLEIKNPERKGLYVKGLSSFPSEDEVILGGKVKTISVKGRILEKVSPGKYQFVISNDPLKIIKYHKLAMHPIIQRKYVTARIQLVKITCELI